MILRKGGVLGGRVESIEKGETTLFFPLPSQARDTIDKIGVQGLASKYLEY